MSGDGLAHGQPSQQLTERRWFVGSGSRAQQEKPAAIAGGGLGFRASTHGVSIKRRWTGTSDDGFSAQGDGFPQVLPVAAQWVRSVSRLDGSNSRKRALVAVAQSTGLLAAFFDVLASIKAPWPALLSKTASGIGQRQLSPARIRARAHIGLLHG